MIGWFAVGYNPLSDCVDCRGIEAKLDRSHGDSGTTFTEVVVVPLCLVIFAAVRG